MSEIRIERRDGESDSDLRERLAQEIGRLARVAREPFVVVSDIGRYPCAPNPLRPPVWC